MSESECYEIRDNFERFKGTKLSNIFDINYSKIHKLSIATLVLECANIFLHCVFVVLFCLLKKKFLIYIYVCLNLLLELSIFILSMIIFYYMEKSDLTKYDNFLDCPNVRPKIFKKISDVNRFVKCFYAFVIMNFIQMGLDKCEKKVDFPDDAKNNEISNNSKYI